MGLFDIFSNSDAQDAANARIAGINTGLTNATGAINTGTANANNYYGKALQPFQTLSGYATPGINAYSDALGLNGAAGNTRAMTGFQNNPGYQFQLGQGLQAIDRGAAARGMVSSGNTAMAENNYAQNTANTGWNQYLSSFSPFFTLAGQGAQGQGAVGSAQAGTNYDAGKTLGTLNYNAATGVGDANASADMAKYGASANQWNLLQNGLGLGASLLGFSDRRIKKDVRRVGKTADGLPLYTFKYLGGSETHRGVMAQDVEKVDPDAVLEIGGVKAVDYGRVAGRAARAAAFDVLSGMKMAA